MTARSKSGIRKPSNTAKRPQFIVFSEGKETEPGYINNWYRIYRDRVIVKVSPHRETTPLELVTRAIKQRRSDQSEARRGRGDAYDEYWCIFDVDRHPNLADALDLATSSGIRVAISRPCIELWFILHFEYHAGYLETAQAEHLSQGHLGCGKTLSPKALDLLVASYKTAKDHAQRLDQKHAEDGSSPNSNPSSSVWHLIDLITGETA
jgi:hypothetical protein